jgi:hypothetical protein
MNNKIKIIAIVSILSIIFLYVIGVAIKGKIDKSAIIKNNDEVIEGKSSSLIDKSKFFSNTKNGDAFNIEASKIIGIDENVFQLYEISADVKLKDSTKFSLTADSGQYNFLNKELNLKGNVGLLFYEGLEFSTTQAQVYLEEGRITGSSEVQVQSEIGNINAGSFVVEEFGKKITFYNGVNLDAFFTNN